VDKVKKRTIEEEKNKIKQKIKAVV